VDVGAALLASGPSLASRGFRSVQSSARLVSYLFLAIVHSLTSVFSFRDRLDLLNTGDGALSRGRFREDASGIDAGLTTNNASRRCHTSPNLNLS